jgi:hypothetical protein
MSYLIYDLFTFFFPWPIISIAYVTNIYVTSPRQLLRLLLPRRVCRDPTTFPNWKYVPPALFSVSYHDAIIDSSSMALLSIFIPIQWSQPVTQHEQKEKKQRTIRCRPVTWRHFLWYPLLFFAFVSAPHVHTLPGTNHAIIHHKREGDTSGLRGV